MKIKRGQLWQSKIYEVVIHVLSVNEGKNTVVAEDHAGIKIHYILDTFQEYFEPSNNQFTRVIFRMADTDVIAFLLDADSYDGNVMSYMHVGQHGEASLEYARCCEPATPSQYCGLKQELESIGYFVKVVNRFPSGFICGKDA